MRKFNIGDVVSLTESYGKIPADVTARVIDFCINNSRYEYRLKTIALGTEEYVTESLLKKCAKHMCPKCGMDYYNEDMEEHMMLEHGIVFKEQHNQAEQEIIEIDRIQKLKAEQYDRICEMMFMACGIVDDGDSVKYIIDPETVCNELLKIIIEDENVDREKLIDAKEKRFKEITLW